MCRGTNRRPTANTRMKILLALTAALAAGALHAQTTVRVVRLAESPDARPVFHVWGGRPLELALEVTAADPSHHVSVRADVYQLAGAIAAPLSQKLPVAQELSFERSLARFENWKLPLPAVRHATSFELRFAAQADAAGDWRPAGSARLVVYPSDLGEQLKEMVTSAQTSGSGRLAVFGKSPDLKAALQSVEIPFEEVGEAPPDELDASLVYLGQSSQSDIEAITAHARSRGRMVIFADDARQLPGVYWTDYNGGFVAKVTMPLLADFAHSPQRQSALLDLLQHAFQTSRSSP